MELVEVVVQGLTLGSAYAVVAVGFVLVFKASKILNLAYGSIIMLLSYLLCEFTVSHDFPLWLSLLLLFPIGAGMCFVLERFTIRPLIGQPFLASLVLTLALGMILNGVAVLIWAGRSYSYPFYPFGGVNIGDVMIMKSGLWAVAVAVVVFALVGLFFRYTKAGLIMRAVAEGHALAQSTGVSAKRMFSLSWVLSGSVAVVSGMVVGLLFTINLDMSGLGLGKGLPVLLLGGMGSVQGALVGGLIIGVLESVGAYFGMVREVIPWLVMLFILLIRPYGMWGERRIERI